MSWNEYQKTMINRSLSIFDIARNGDLEELKNLFKHLSDSTSSYYLEQVDHRGSSPLMLAAYHGHVELVRELLFKGANPNSIDFAGNSILMGVSFKGYKDIAKILIQYGAEITYKNPQGMTAIDYAIMFGRSEIKDLLTQLMVDNQTNLHHRSSNSVFKNANSFIQTWLKFIFTKKGVN